MSELNVRDESQHILQDNLLKWLDLPQEFKKAAQKVTFTGRETRPWMPTPCKITESASSLLALLASGASAVAADRYGIDLQDIKVDTDIATLFIISIMVPHIGKESVFKLQPVKDILAKADHNQIAKPIHVFCSNVYQCKDGKYYHLHGSMNAAPTMKMVGQEEVDVTREEAIKLYSDKVAQWDSAEIDKTANEVYKQAGTVCNTPEEFFASEQGKIMGAEPLWNVKPIKAPRSSWPKPAAGTQYKPLAGIKVIDFSRVIAAPVASKLLALQGAEVLKVSCSRNPEVGLFWVDVNTGKRDCDIDLKTEEGKKTFAALVKDADVLIDGFRPGVLSRLGFTSEGLRKLNPTLVYVRENCYGFKGPLAYRSGWQQISDCLVGIAWLQGKMLGLNEPVVPPVANSDYQTGIIGAIAVTQALYERTKSDVTFDVDISLTQYNIWYYRLGQYSAEQQKEIMSRNSTFKARHYDEMQTLFVRMYETIKITRPELINDPATYVDMSGKDWNLDENIRILAPPFKLSESTLEYTVPSGDRCRSKAEWTT